MREDTNVAKLYRDALAGRLSRRQVLRRAAILGLSIPALGALLAACGGDDDDATTTTGGATAAPTRPSTAATAVTASPATTGSPAASPRPSGSPSGSPTGSPTSGGALTRQYAGQTIRWSTSLAEAERKVFDSTVLPDFERQTGIKVQFLQIESADFIRQLQAQVQANRVQVDFFAIDNNSLAPLVANNLIEDLSQYQSMIPAETIQTLLPVLRFNNTLYFLPYRPNVQITYYNSTKFKEYNLQTPKTWDELLSVGKALKDRENIGRIAVQASPEAGAGPVGVTVTEFIWQAGGDPLVLNSAESQRAFEYLRQLNQYLSPQTPTAKFDTMNTYISNNSVYLGQNWPFGVNVIVQDNKREDVLAYSGWAGPAGEVHVLGGEVLGIPKGSPNREPALVFAQYLMSNQTQSLLTKELAWPSVRTDAYGSVESWQQPYFEAVKASMEKARARPNVVYWTEVQRIMGDAWNEVVQGSGNIKQGLDKYQAQLEQAKQKAGG